MAATPVSGNGEKHFSLKADTCNPKIGMPVHKNSKVIKTLANMKGFTSY